MHGQACWGGGGEVLGTPGSPRLAVAANGGLRGSGGCVSGPHIAEPASYRWLGVACSGTRVS